MVDEGKPSKTYVAPAGTPPPNNAREPIPSWPEPWQMVDGTGGVKFTVSPREIVGEKKIKEYIRHTGTSKLYDLLPMNQNNPLYQRWIQDEIERRRKPIGY